MQSSSSQLRFVTLAFCSIAALLLVIPSALAEQTSQRSGLRVATTEGQCLENNRIMERACSGIDPANVKFCRQQASERLGECRERVRASRPRPAPQTADDCVRQADQNTSLHCTGMTDPSERSECRKTVQAQYRRCVNRVEETKRRREHAEKDRVQPSAPVPQPRASPPPMTAAPRSPGPGSAPVSGACQLLGTC
jgi:hypothetical protein